MQPAKKVEIIVSSLGVEEVLAILEAAKVSGYTVIKSNYGKGDHGISNDDLGEISSNSYIITVCNQESQLNQVVRDITPMLTKFGGICLVSDANLVS
jgi:nitrogen regulatory protein PII